MTVYTRVDRYTMISKFVVPCCCADTSSTHFSSDLSSFVMHVKKSLTRVVDESIHSKVSKRSKRKRKKQRNVPRNLELCNHDDGDVSAIGDIETSTLSTYYCTDDSINSTDSMHETSTPSSCSNLHKVFSPILSENSFEGQSSIYLKLYPEDKYLIEDLKEDKYDSVHEYTCENTSNYVKAKLDDRSNVLHNCHFQRGNNGDVIGSPHMEANAKKTKVPLRNSSEFCVVNTFDVKNTDGMANYSSQSKEMQIVKSIGSNARSSKQQYKIQENRASIASKSNSLSKRCHAYYRHKEVKGKENQRSLEKVITKPNNNADRTRSLENKDSLSDFNCLDNRVTQSVKIIAPYYLMPGCTVKANICGKDIRAKVVSVCI